MLPGLDRVSTHVAILVTSFDIDGSPGHAVGGSAARHGDLVGSQGAQQSQHHSSAAASSSDSPKVQISPAHSHTSSKYDYFAVKKGNYFATNADPHDSFRAEHRDRIEENHFIATGGHRS